jgi:ferredoxin
MIKFLLRLPLGHGAHAAVISTRGGIRIGQLVLPGATGWALLFPLLVLALKGYEVRAGLGIDMPVNIINLHWGLAPDNVEFISAWGKRRHQRLVDALLGGRRYFHPINLVWEAIWGVGLLVLWPIFPLAYLAVGRVFMGKLLFADASCRGCGRCSRICPNQAIKMLGAKPQMPFWTHRCETCLRCMGYCKHRAIQASHLWIAPSIYATTFVGAGVLQHLALVLLGFRLSVWDPLWEVLSIGLSFVVLVLVYYAFWGLQHIRPVHVFLSYATLTKYYKRRYHEPQSEWKDLQ